MSSNHYVLDESDGILCVVLSRQPHPPPPSLSPQRSVSDVVMIRVALSSCHPPCGLSHPSPPPPPPSCFLHPLSSPFGISSISLLFIHHSVPSSAFKHTLNPRVFHTLTKAFALNAEHTMIFPPFTHLTCSFLHYGWESLKCLSMNPVNFLMCKNMPENCILPD